MTENMELVSYVGLKLQFERSALFLFKFPYCFGEFIFHMISQGQILCSHLQAGNSLVLCVNDWFPQEVTTWLSGAFDLLATAKAGSVLGIFLFLLFLPHTFHLLNTVRVHTENTGPYREFHSVNTSIFSVPQMFSAG
jgi:hypothetical protein